MSETIRWISETIDRHNRTSIPHLDLIRVSKVAEEAGEAMAAMVAWQGTNPRKPAGTLEDVITELADVALAALCAIEHFDLDSDQVLAARADHVWERLRA